MKLCMFFTFFCPKSRADFLTHIPNRTLRIFPPNYRLHVVYFGHLDEALLDRNIIASRVRFTRSKGLFTLFKPFILFCTAFFYGYKNRIDIFINANSHLDLFYLCWAANLLKSKVIGRVAGHLVPRPGKRVRSRLKHTYKKMKERLSLDCADQVIALSSFLERDLTSRGCPGRKIRVIPQGVDTDRFTFKTNFPSRPEQIIFIGRIKKTKGIIEAINAFNQISKTYPWLSLHFYGDGEDREILEDRCAGDNKIHFHGFVEYGKIQRKLKKADILLLPSYKEGLPNVVLEAMSSGVLVIASNVGGIPEILDNGRLGVLINPGNERDIFGAITLVMENPGLRSRMTRDARKAVEESYSFGAAQEKIKELLYELKA